MSPKRVKRRANREGTVRRKGRWWYAIVTVAPGVRREFKLKTTKKSVALERLREIIDEVRTGKHRPDRSTVLVRDAWQRLVQNYKATGRKEIPSKRWAHLEPIFGADDVRAITTERVEQYVTERRRADAAPATINREVACLRRMLRLVRDDGVVFPRFPRFPRVIEDNVRTDFFTDEEVSALYAELPDYLQPMLVLGYWLGWRRGEVLGLQWRQIDLEAGTARLDPGTTKNRSGRYVHLPPAALAELVAWRKRTEEIEKQIERIIPWVIHHAGEPIRNHYGAWRSACERAGLAGRRFHDLRRSAARNYVRAGISEKVAMAITGHKTRSVFDRYDIVADTDLQRAAEQVGRATVEKTWKKRRRAK